MKGRLPTGGHPNVGRVGPQHGVLPRGLSNRLTEGAEGFIVSFALSEAPN